jgi:hypothetical protein
MSSGWIAHRVALQFGRRFEQRETVLRQGQISELTARSAHGHAVASEMRPTRPTR